ncbi:exonuclease domain-containing protein [Shewanella psychrotolerans]|uniref:exonuclease domain-containing protein n=1 Tax=Shewanella psychrotolerans TaxID=2864206 RepID=UPI001C65C215|nr:exonuclease domain-containing protein [Shewanella psychrotolerans]QYK02811.1 3'-5' exonuclease [Shewanella psychrotolerans]
MLNHQVLKSRLCWRAFKAQNSTIKQYHQALLETLSQPVNDASFAAVDLEMTGLNPAFDQILSIGIVPIRYNQLILSEAEHKLVQIDGSVGQSATIHGILDVHLERAIVVEEMTQWFLEVTMGKVLVAHHAPLDLAFLQAALVPMCHEKVKLMAVDTLALEKKRLLRQHEVLKEGSLRLGASRARYGLPVYAAHNALIDALACGELLLAQIAAMGDAKQLKVSELFC